jgi:hypothetical protein
MSKMKDLWYDHHMDKHNNYNSSNATNGESNKETTMSETTYPLDLTITELEALNKTVGIAIDNLTQKINKHGADSPLGRTAKADRSALWDCAVRIHEALGEEYNG